MKKILVTRSSMPPFEEYVEEIKSLWDSRWLTNKGAKHEQFRDALRKYLQVPGISLFTNGHTALEVSLRSLHLDGEVITPPFTFVSTTHAIVNSGLKPVFCDINPTDFTIDVDKIERLITKNTVAIMPVHVYGNVCDVEKIENLAKHYHLKVIYDAAHAFGVRYKGKSIASFGDISCFSFHATKVFHTIEGGAACYQDTTLDDKLWMLSDFGIADAESIPVIGINGKMNEFCAAMGLCNMRHLDAEIAKRKNVVDRYRKQLGNIKGIQLNVVQDQVVSNYAYFPIVVDDKKLGMSRDQLVVELQKHDIYARKYFYPITNDIACYHGKYNDHPTPIALDISRRILTLPLYADLSFDDVDKVCSIIRNCSIK